MLQTQVTLPTTITTTTTTTTATTLIDSFHAHHGVCWLHHKLNISEHISGYLLKKLSNHFFLQRQSKRFASSNKTYTTYG